MQADRCLQPGTRASIGIVAGSGPEAGLDLWAKVLKRNQAELGERFRGDLDAPRVIVVSEPELGMSMDLASNDATVWSAMQRSIAALAPCVDAFAIACNTLNWYAPRIASLGLAAELISFQSVLRSWIERTGTQRLALLGASPVTEMGEWSTYQGLADYVEIELPADPATLHQLIGDVKRLGSANATLQPRFAQLVADLESDVVLLACTELPLISSINTSKTLVDVTDLVAEALVARSFAGRTGHMNSNPQQQQ